MKNVHAKTFAVSLAAIAALGFSACSSNKSQSAQQTSPPPAMSTMAPVATSATMPAANLIGTGCADYSAQHPSGPASVTGMSQDLLATAASNNAAFDKLPQSTIDELKTNADMLKSILTYHVVQGQESPNTVDGAHKTLQGAEVKVTGEGNGLKVDNAGLVCGGVHTANATVYMIDTVLTPPNR